MSTPIKTGQISETKPADQRAGSPGQHVPYDAPLNPSTSRTNSLAPFSIASLGERTRSSTPADQRAGSPYMSYNHNGTLQVSRPTNSSSVIAPPIDRPISASTASTSALPLSSLSVRRNPTALTNDADKEKFVSYSNPKPTQTAPLAATASVSSTKAEPVKDPAEPGDYFKPYSASDSTFPSTIALGQPNPAPASAFKPRTESQGLPHSPYQKWVRLNPNLTQLPATSLVEKQSVSPLKQGKPKVVASSDSSNGISTPPSIQFMSLQSPVKPQPLNPRDARSPSPIREDNNNGRMSRGFNNSPSTSTPPISSPSPTAMLVSSSSQTLSPTTSSLIASSVSPSSASTSPSSSTPKPHEAARKPYVTYNESRLPEPTRKLTEQEILERSETVISGLQFDPRKASRKTVIRLSEALSSSNVSKQETTKKMDQNQK